MNEPHEVLDAECPSDAVLLRTIFQGKWRLRVLQELLKGPVRLSHLRRTIPECSKKVLIDTLHGLEDLGWIERREYPTKLRKVEYSLTNGFQEDLRRTVANMSRDTQGPIPK